MATTVPTVNTPTTGGMSTQGGLSSWISPYITDYLGKSQALANTDYQMYQGPLTAGASNLQTQAFQGIGGLTAPGPIGGTYNPVGSNFTTQQAQQYMNPYLQTALNPQLDEIRRQAQMTQMQNAGRMAKAGSFGGSRQAVLDAANQRDMASQMARTTGEGYATAYDKAAQQFNEDQRRQIGEAQFGAEFGLKGGLASLGAQRDILRDQMAAGEVQRGIESEGIAADLAEFNQQRDFPYEQLKFQQSMISGLPASAVASPIASNPGGLASLLNVLGSAGAINQSWGDISQLLGNLGLGD